MNINVTLFSVAIIILLFVPGFFFKKQYYTGKFSKQFSAGDFAERAITSIFWGIVIQIITIAIVGKILNTNYQDVRNGINSFYSEIGENRMPLCTPTHFNYAISYILASITIAVILGITCHRVVRILRLDRRFNTLKFTNDWDYYFNGDLNKTYNKFFGRKKVMTAVLDVLIKDGTDKGKLYSGFLADYTLSHTNGEIETLVLRKTQRWSNTKKEFVDIGGEFFIIPYNKVINSNVKYIVQETQTKFQDIVLLLCILALPCILFWFPYKYSHTNGVISLIFGMIFILSSWFSMSLLLVGGIFSVENKVKLSKLEYRSLLIVLTIAMYLFYKVGMFILN